MKKKLGVIAILTIIIVIGLLFLCTGGKMASAMLVDYSLSEDGKIMTLKVGVATSMGYVRTLKTSEDGNKKRITFYSTYGLNSNIGAKNEFQVELSPSCDEIYFYSGNDEYKLKLQKNNQTNAWERSK
ncbi:hypothetical protein [Desulfitobacterium chlororespirans]|uniref:Uncharacterized protein n=1 Tax=Desulfitobacterium chlororespirans DSM 11544 TaxID=1121395 RepID=A0A1M7UKH3_9FIRM|nr:hypothetical protein [Desulfitobacterium chlororespirans]SHN83522.1 hypothetical protein SAMN02745215_04055 [Desulfitobacterium chlororespirans DSM 11544]